MEISIIGSYISQFGELWDKSLTDLLFEAVNGSVKNAQIEKQEIEAIFVANMASGLYSNQLHLGALASQIFEHLPPSSKIEGACASGGLAIIAAQQALLSKLYKTVLVVGVEKMTDSSTASTTKNLMAAADFDKEYGSTFPGLYAILAQSHINKFATTRDQFSAVAVKNHRHALKNPHAHFHKEINIDQVNNSSLVADPLRLLDCSPISDGAAAVILTSKKSSSAKIMAFGQGQDSLDLASRDKLHSLLASKKAIAQALNKAKISIKQIQVAEVHDCFTIAEIMAIEDLGFFTAGEGAIATQTGQTTYGGTIVINPSGGLKACGHPVGATGVKQVAYIADLINRGKFNCGLTHNVGGSGATAVVNIIGNI